MSSRMNLTRRRSLALIGGVFGWLTIGQSKIAKAVEKSNNPHSGAGKRDLIIRDGVYTDQIGDWILTGFDENFIFEQVRNIVPYESADAMKYSRETKLSVLIRMPNINVARTERTLQISFPFGSRYQWRDKKIDCILYVDDREFAYLNQLNGNLLWPDIPLDKIEELAKGNTLTLILNENGRAHYRVDFPLGGTIRTLKIAQQYFASFSRSAGSRGKASASTIDDDCFVTTAVCQHIGLDDDCFELRVLRAFRDGPLRRLPGGLDAIREYYDRAPGYVAHLSSIWKKREWLMLYVRWILPCVAMARLGFHRLTYRRYRQMMLFMQKQCE